FHLLYVHDMPPSEIYTLSLHDALPIYNFRYLVKANGYNNSQQMDLLRNTAAAKGIAKDGTSDRGKVGITKEVVKQAWKTLPKSVDRKSTRLNSSHVSISYAVFCLKKKK